MKTNSKSNTALVLGSGAARGVAHIGVIEALESREIRPDMIVGSSMGAVVGAVYGAGKMDEFSEFLTSLDWRDIVYYCDFVFPQQGLLEGKRILDKLEEIIGEITIEELGIPFFAVSTNLKTGQPVIFDKGKVTTALRASFSVPGIFQPAEIDEEWYLDGGLVAPLPIKQARELGASTVIAVDLNHDQINRNTRRRTIKRFDRKDILNKPVEKNVSEEDGRVSIWNHVERRYKTVEQSMRLALYNLIQADKLENKSPNIFDVLGSSMTIMEHNLSKITLEQYPPEILIQPRLSHLNFFDFDNAPEAIRTGYKAAVDVFDKNPEIFNHITP